LLDAFTRTLTQEAADETVPLIERIRFLGIYSANLDEFFRVRIAGIRRSAILEVAKTTGKKPIHCYISKLAINFSNKRLLKILNYYLFL
jgi:polyphosphate kinase